MYAFAAQPFGAEAKPVLLMWEPEPGFEESKGHDNVVMWSLIFGVFWLPMLVCFFGCIACVAKD